MNELSRCQPLLGTFVRLRLRSDSCEQALIKISEQVFKEIQRIHNLMSFHDHDSELSYINKNAYVKDCRLSKNMQDVLGLASYMSHLSGGIFDITIAPELIDKGLLPANYDVDQYQGDWRDIVIEDHTIRFR